ncbi:nuclear transport factor 2 family protein [Tabrizicola sp. BL-A-41-H6]|uniref:nuclear transport factor 2 family protein n=1 Tax=Tabrizicola sp. BL-A-41-H6 TaxID=3421107 RepID=UPI003D679B8C
MDQGAAIQMLLNRVAITDLIHAYCFHFDRNEPAAVAALFSADAVVDYGPEVPDLIGAQAISAAIASGLTKTFAATSHHVSNVTITFDTPDQAHSICYLYAWHRYHNGAPDGELWGQYHHRFAREPDGWRISSLVLKAAGSQDFHRATMHPIGRR